MCTSLLLSVSDLLLKLNFPPYLLHLDLAHEVVPERSAVVVETSKGLTVTLTKV